MAFCIRSERKIDFKNKDIFPGPGQYIKIDPKKILNNKRKFPPFFSSAKRAPFVKLNNIPGPGSYNLDKNYFTNHQSNPMQSTNISIEKDDNNFKELIINYNSPEKNNNISTAWQMSSYSNSSKLNDISNKNKSKSYISKDKATQNSNILKLTETYFNTYSKFYGKNIGFLSQSNRFDEFNKEELNNPGPGTYYDSILSTSDRKEKKIKNKIKNGKIFGESGSLSRIVSIPSKTMNGYIYQNFENIKENKEKITSNSFTKNNDNHNLSFSLTTTKNNIKKNKILNKAENKLFDNKFQLLINERKFGSTTNTTTSEFVGPGTYDVSFFDKRNNVINWSKGFDLVKISKKNSIIKTAKLLEEMKKNGDEMPIMRTFHRKMHQIRPNNSKIILLYNLKRIKNNLLKNKIPYESRSSFIPDKTEIPGPGYYDRDVFPFTEKKKTKLSKLGQELKNKPKKIPNLNYIKYHFGNIKLDPSFGSHCERPFNKSKSFEDLSPFSYFQEKNKFDPGKKNTLYKHIILGKTDMSHTSYHNYDFYSPTPDVTKESQENEFINIVTSTNTNNTNTITNQFNTFQKNKKVETIKSQNTLSIFTTKSEKRLFNNLDLTMKTFFNKLNNIPLIDLDKYKYFNSNPGPGDYNLSHKFVIPSFNKHSLMQSKSERFKEIKRDENPGPGSYQLGKNYEKKLLLKKIYFKKVNTDLVKQEKIKKIMERNKTRNETPGVGHYNLDKKNSFIYKIHSKYNKIQGYNSPFLISSSRFKRQKIFSEISSGDYDPYKFEKIQKNNQYMVFNKAERFNQDNELYVGPGSYDLSPDWNKKSYNKLFSPNNNEVKIY